MRLRVTDERVWASEFDAASPAELAAGIRRAWDERIREAGASEHPAIALRARLAEVDRWLAERMAREGATDEQRQSWRANAVHRRYQARRDLGDATLSTLRLHVRGETGAGTWLTIMRPAPGNEAGAPLALTEDGRTFTGWRCDPTAPTVGRVVSDEDARRLFAGAAAMVTWERCLWGLGEAVSEAVRRAQYPAPRIVSTEPSDEESAS